MALVLPLPVFSFNVALFPDDDSRGGGFTEVSGLSMDRASEDYREGGENRFTHKLPGRANPGAITLKRGVMPVASQFHNWVQKSIESDLAKPITPQDLVISMLDQQQAPVMVWNVARAWPVKVHFSDLNATENAIAYASVELTCRSIAVQAPGQ